MLNVLLLKRCILYSSLAHRIGIKRYTGVPEVNVIIILGQIITVDVGGNVVSEFGLLDRQCDNVAGGR